MRRSAVLGMFGAVVLGLGSLTAPTAVAAVAVSGQVGYFSSGPMWDDAAQAWTGSWAPLSGVTVVAYTQRSSGGPGKVAATATTDAAGAFTISASAATSGVCLQVKPSLDWQQGWYWSDIRYDFGADLLQFSAPAVCDVSGSLPQPIALMNARAWGQVVNQVGQPVAGVSVRYVPVDTASATVTGTTGADGTFRIVGLNYEEYFIRVTASKVIGGYLACDNHVVGSAGDACTHGTGDIGQIIVTAR